MLSDKINDNTCHVYNGKCDKKLLLHIKIGKVIEENWLIFD